MTPTELPFNPFRRTLYTAQELLEGYRPNSPRSFQETPDFNTFRYARAYRRAPSLDALASILQALHDNTINQAMTSFVRTCGKLIAIAGGHKEVRGSSLYWSTANMAKRLSELGFFLVSGGGPGVMEATHLGARFSGQSARALAAAMKRLSRVSVLPSGSRLLTPDGKVDQSIAKALHAWYRPAFELAQEPSASGESLALPTWFYGHEPFSPLATHIAKFFQNSLREESLMRVVTHGVIYVPGRAGTLQELFQDVSMNYYRLENVPFRPMVFFDVGGYWSKQVPVRELLEALFPHKGNRNKQRPAILFTEDEGEAVDFLARKSSA